MLIGIPREVKDGEKRIGLTPDKTDLIIQGGHRVIIESDAGLGAGFSNEEYEGVGAEIVSNHSDVYSQADVVIKVKEPQPEEFELLREGLVLFCYLHLAAEPAVTEALIKSKTTGIAYETVQSLDGSLPLLYPMSEIAGKLAAQVATRLMQSDFGGSGRLLGGVPGAEACRFIIVGGGTVGFNAGLIATGLGARVTIFDRDLIRLRYIEHITRGKIKGLFSTPGSLSKFLPRADIVVSSVLIPGAKAPRVVTEEMLENMKRPKGEVVIGIVGKYVEFGESYKSLNEALIHAGLFHNLKTKVHWIEAEGVEGENWADQLSKFDGILVPGGFGKRGIEGMIRAVNFARNQKVPFFGICLGMQCSVIEFARNVAGLQGANSSEFDPSTPHRVIYKLRELRGVDDLGGTMRLGAYPCILNSKSHTFNAYGDLELSERHRHRYEFNREYEEILIAQGMKIVGSSPDNNFVEVVELEDHPWFVGCQCHPEFKSKPLKPHPLFKGFVNASYVNRNQRQKKSQLETDQLIDKKIK